MKRFAANEAKGDGKGENRNWGRAAGRKFGDAAQIGAEFIRMAGRRLLRELLEVWLEFRVSLGP
jgi:hypothetical protein